MARWMMTFFPKEYHLGRRGRHGGCHCEWSVLGEIWYPRKREVIRVPGELLYILGQPIVTDWNTCFLRCARRCGYRQDCER